MRAGLLWRSIVGVAAVATVLAGRAVAQPGTFADAFARIRDRPEFAHSFFGVEVYSIDRKKVLYAWNGDKLFVTGSTAKALTEGVTLELLGADFRFHTPLYRTGPVRDGVLHGDLVLVASGDPNLSSRRQPDGTLAYADEDHSYGGFDARLIPGDPAAPLAWLADKVAAAGIRRVEGRVLVDTGLFEEGSREMGTGVVRSPIVVNDNVVDLLIAPGATNGPASLRASPEVPYLRFVNRMTTAAKGADTALRRTERTLPDGTIEVTVTGHIPSDRGTYVAAYPVASPSRFAAALFAARLTAKGIVVAPPEGPAPPVERHAAYPAADMLGEWISAPIAEDVKVTLKTSQNLHASLMPFVWGGVLAPGEGPADRRGFGLARAMLTKAGVDIAGIMQSNGEGGALFTPDFIAHFLAYMAGRPSYRLYHDALPVLGRSGTLKDILPNSPAAGQVFAKTGTHIGPNLLGDGVMVSGKALAGYTTTPSGERVAIAVYLNNVPIAADLDDPTAVTAAVSRVTGDTVAEIAAAVHLYPIVAK